MLVAARAARSALTNYEPRTSTTHKRRAMLKTQRLNSSSGSVQQIEQTFAYQIKREAHASKRDEKWQKFPTLVSRGQSRVGALLSECERHSFAFLSALNFISRFTIDISAARAENVSCVRAKPLHLRFIISFGLSRCGVQIPAPQPLGVHSALLSAASRPRLPPTRNNSGFAAQCTFARLAAAPGNRGESIALAETDRCSSRRRSA